MNVRWTGKKVLVAVVAAGIIGDKLNVWTRLGGLLGRFGGGAK